MIANLKTHKVYPEVMIDTITGQWTGKLIDIKGNVEATYTGKVPVEGKHYIDIRAEASKAAHAKFNLIIEKYEV